MFRLSLILTLATFQLLGGSGRSLYLCVSNDGACHCLDSGPLSCTCCRHDDDASSFDRSSCDRTSEECESNCCCHDGAKSCPDDNHSPKSQDGPTLANNGCNCTHELVSTGQVSSHVRSSVSDQVHDAMQHLAFSPIAIQQAPLLALVVRVCWHGPPPLPDVAISVLSTVAIRC